MADPRDDDAGRAPGPRTGRPADPAGGDGDTSRGGDPGPAGPAGHAGHVGAVEDAAWVEAARAGDEQAFGRLFDRWFDPVYDVAWRIVRNADTAAEVAQDVFLAAWQGLDGLEQPGSFGGWVRRIARNRALNRLDRERRSTPDDEQAAAALDRSAPDVDLSAALGERDQRELVWAAASALGERDASLLDLHLRHGFGAGEIARELGVTTNNAHQLLHRLKGRLGGAISAWVLWRGAAPDCPGLDRAVSAAGIAAFGADAVRVIGRHAQGCDDCSERQQLRLAPEALFAAMPIMVAPQLLKAEAAAALGQAGVPMGGSATTAGGGAGGDAPGPEAGSPTDPADGGAGDGVAGDGVAGDGVAGDGAAGDGAAGDDAAGDGLADGAAGDGGAGDGAGSAGPSDGGAGHAGAGDAAAEHHRSHRRAPAVAGVVALIVVLGLAGALFAGDGGDEVETAQRRTSTTAVTTDPSSSTASSLPAAAPEATDPALSSTTETTAVARTTTTVDAGEPLPEVDPTTGSTDTTPPAPPPPPPDPQPTISGFRATSPGTWCGATPSAGTGTVTLTWQSLDADSATISGPGGTTGGPASGATSRCAASGDTFTLTVAGPGGTADRSVTVP